MANHNSRVNNRAEFAKIEAISQSDLLRTQIWRDDSVCIKLVLIDGAANDVDELAHFLLGLEKINRKIESKSSGGARNQIREETADSDEVAAGNTISVRDIWHTLIGLEEESFCTVVIAGEKRASPRKQGQILIPYHTDTGVIDYEPSDIVYVQNLTREGEWRKAGVLNLRDTTFGHLAELAVEDVHIRATFRIGSRLRLVSTLEQASFSRRRAAVDRILEEKSVVPALIHYFEPDAAASLEPVLYPTPSEEDLDIYSEGDKKLNSSQRASFKRVVGNGPVSLLQGPPGTGKTFFIAALLHYLMTKERARRILLVSQAHEAVNNALEKAMDLCQARGTSFDAVRLGSESAASEAIRHLHSASIEESYRERFKAEKKERIIQLASSLGLPKSFAVAFTELHLRLGSLERQIGKLAAPNDQVDEKERTSLAIKVRALTETFFAIARDLYDFSEDVTPVVALEHLERTIMHKHEVQSLDAVKRLRQLIGLSEEWLNALRSPGGHFVEFLAKSRTVVAGTCVGIGYRGAGVVQNVYDWVIIDEAGRAAPSELAVAMQTGRRILLVGDHKQLPPTISEAVKTAIQTKFGVDGDSTYLTSDFERIFNSEYGRRVGTTLLTQYRMAPVIGELVSDCFYDGKLQTDRPEPPEYYDLLPESLSKQVAWVDMTPLGERGFEQSSADDRDKWNTTEARVVMGVLKTIIDSDFMAFLEEDLLPQEPAIGIICMYDKQRELIDRIKAEAVWLDDARRLVKIDTVDSYQGKENRIIIVTTVRNNRELRPGFLHSPNRINVAMSRAMERLIIVGASGMWKGRNTLLPLGRTVAKVERLQSEGKALVIPADHFLE